ncbi:MAG: alkaline phosphatase family protein [Treponemataceae bacterium]|nr:alkaline phosphatase family protein [Treponemataceae bacterium]
MIKPDYTTSHVNLISSIISYCGGKPYHTGLKAFEDFATKSGKASKKWKNIVLMLFDGMGMDALSHFLELGSFLRSNLVGQISSVFPPTTTAATTTLESGLTPAEHGWLGWTLYIPQLDKNIALFPNVIQDSKIQAADFNVAKRFMPYKSVYDIISQGGEYRAYSVSPYGSVETHTKKQYYTEIERLCGEAGKKYIYAYQEYPDNMMHLMGTYAHTVEATVKSINRNVRKLCRKLADNEGTRNTLVIVTADHGHTPIKNLILEDFPEIHDMLLRPATIEPRACNFFVKPECLEAFPEAFNALFKEDFHLFSREEILKEGLFGNLGSERIHPTFEDSSLGDFLAVATGDKALVNSHKSNRFRSHHAGATEKEMRVPFIAIDINAMPR